MIYNTPLRFTTRHFAQRFLIDAVTFIFFRSPSSPNDLSVQTLFSKLPWLLEAKGTIIHILHILSRLSLDLTVK
jgi:hypothetical protein